MIVRRYENIPRHVTHRVNGLDPVPSLWITQEDSIALLGSWKFVVDCSSFSSGHFATDHIEINESVPSVNRTFLTLLTDPLLLSTAKGQAGSLGYRSYQTMSFVFSGTLTPLPAFGVLFDNEEVKGPLIQSLIRPEEYLKRLHPIDLEKLQFVGDSQDSETRGRGTCRGIGFRWTALDTVPNLLRALLSNITKVITEYFVYKIEHIAHCIQIFNSWGGQLTSEMWEPWSKPYIKEIIHAVKRRCSDTPIVFYINGNRGFLKPMLLDLTGLSKGRVVKIAGPAGIYSILKHRTRCPSRDVRGSHG
ncbi:hypothetical protein Bca101_058457 [Brassica carinata]